MKGTKAGKAFAAALIAENIVLKELDLSGGKDRWGDSVPNIDIAFAREFAVGLGANGAMKKLTISGDKSFSKPVTIETSMTEADFGDKGLGVSGAIMLAAFLPKCR